ncbi:amino acid adenylation domain-containing protein [Pseudoalteromonas sp. JBTF-M23]|uniref:Amino acid adenylation domain-containing protein n=1 Tax=Pseudoalteromonas caenipelagi TaxID=2726988 RepID=A0A849VD39_9GAMM|nr:non-ribosomal peptide synthetase [Pseudoalteromonas caenipelagi]NOU51322.1 amino acid adenylation domain-containing protein [Pseudoalteromonas caenipelagi]
MKIVNIIAECAKQQVELSVNGNDLEVSFDQYPSEELIANLREKKADILAFIQAQQNSTRTEVEAITPVSREGKLPLSFTQQRLWLANKVEGGSVHYNMPARLKLTGTLDFAALEQAFTTIVSRHESLRTRFLEDEQGEPYQQIQQDYQFNVRYTDLSHLEGVELDARRNDIAQCEAQQCFDLTSDLMLRVQVLKVQADSHEVLVTMHHIASDGWSLGILVDEFSKLYSAFSQGLDNPLAPLDIQYVDYAQWQRNWLKGDMLEEKLSYWSEQLANLPAVHSLPLDYPRPAKQNFTGRTYQSHIDAETTQALNALCKAKGATLYMGLNAIFSVLLARYSNERDIVIGCPIANREQAEIAPLIGFFINTLVLRSNLAGEPSFNELLERTKQMMLDSYSHQQVPFEKIVEKLVPTRSLSFSPLFQIVLALHNNEQHELSLPGVTLSNVEQGGDIAKYDLLLNVSESEQGLTLGWEYSTALFREDTIATMAQHFSNLLQMMLTQPDTSAFALPMLSEPEVALMQNQWNATEVEYDKSLCVHQLFEQQAALNPVQKAVEFNNESLTYQQLNGKANRLANLLIESGVEPGSKVGIYLERSTEMLIAVLATMKAGAAYVPLEPSYPCNRIEAILEDAEIEVALLNSALMESFPMSGVDVLTLDNAATDESWMSEYSDENICVDEVETNAQSLAYILYTSGSTGRPKGVMVPHQGVVNYLTHAQAHYLNDTLIGSVVSSPLAFDATLTTLLTPLMVGKVVRILPAGEGELDSLTAQLADESAWLFKITPAHLDALSQMLPKAGSKTAQHHIVVGGEQLTQSLLAQFRLQLLPNTTFTNEYGPTETVVGCSTYTVTPQSEEQQDSSGAIPIGKPICNTRLYVLSADMQAQPINSVGELYIAGDGVTLGYLNRDEQTQQSFITHPQLGEQKLYRTGDLVRWRGDGELVFVGRADHQVKVRGFRIELGEIEHALRAIDGVRDALVIANTQEGDTKLVAYVVPTEFPGEGEAQSTAKAALAGDYLNKVRQELPSYMVPSNCVVLANMPLTENGKVDRKALPDPDGNALLTAQYVAPSNDVERLLCQKWQTLLQVDRVGVTDNFFDLGGHSLTATRLITQVNQELGLSLSLQLIFDMQTVSEMAAHIEFLQVQQAMTAKQSEVTNQATPEEVEW